MKRLRFEPVLLRAPLCTRSYLWLWRTLNPMTHIQPLCRSLLEYKTVHEPINLRNFILFLLCRVFFSVVHSTDAVHKNEQYQCEAASIFRMYICIYYTLTQATYIKHLLQPNSSADETKFCRPKDSLAFGSGFQFVFLVRRQPLNGKHTYEWSVFAPNTQFISITRWVLIQTFNQDVRA